MSHKGRHILEQRDPTALGLWDSPKVYPQLESEANVTDDELTSILESVGSGPEAAGLVVLMRWAPVQEEGKT